MVGGQDSSESAVDTIIAIDPVSKRIRVAGHLLTPRSDAALVADGAGLKLIGGHNTTAR